MKPHTADTHFPLPNVVDITCVDPSRTPVVAEKLWKTVRLMFQNGVSKSKVMQDNMQDVMKRGKNIGKALNNAMVRHHEAFTCRPRDPYMSFESPLEYQFSCSSSPPRPSRALSRRKLSPATTEHGRRSLRLCRGTADEALRRRVKITGSADSLLSNREKELQVDQAAEEFIERFYRELRLQKWLDHYC